MNSKRRVSKLVRAQGGFTLIEMMIVLGLVALSYLAFILFGFGNKSAVRQEVRNLSGRIRYIYHLAATESRYYRLTFDLNAGTYTAAVSDEPIFVAKQNPDEEKNKTPESGETEFEEGASDDEIVPPEFSESENELLEPYNLDSDTKICSFFVEHQTEALTEGVAELHFFPRGQTEFAVIQICDADQEHIMTLMVNPVTGSITSFDEAKDYQDLLEELQK